METTFVARVTETHMKRIAKTWSEYAGEAVTVHPSVLGSIIGVEPILVSGSELAILRLHHRMKCGRVFFSKPENAWFYANR